MEIRPVFVLATDAEGTARALRKAADLKGESAARVVVLVPHLRAERPEEGRQLANVYRELAAGAGVDATVCVCVCRRIGDIFQHVVSEASTVVIGPRRHLFWPPPERRLAAALARDGHSVILEN